MTSDINVYLNGCDSLMVPECAVYVSVYVCETQQDCFGTKVPWIDIYRSVISLSEITRRMWHGHPFIQRKDIKNSRGGEVGSNSKSGWTKF